MNYHALPHSNLIVYNNEYYKTHYSNFEAFVNISFKDIEVFDVLIDKSIFPPNYNSFLDESIMQFIWIDQAASTKDKVELKVSFYKPKNSSYKDFSISFFNNGKKEITEINLIKNTA